MIPINPLLQFNVFILSDIPQVENKEQEGFKTLKSALVWTKRNLSSLNDIVLIYGYTSNRELIPFHILEGRQIK